MESDFLSIVHSMFTESQEFNRLANTYSKIADRRDLVYFLYYQIVTGLDMIKLWDNGNSTYTNTTSVANESELYKGVKIHYNNKIFSNWCKAPVYGNFN